MINVPCGATIRSRFGGATGSLTDLSILRLLDAINPLATTESTPSNSASSSLLTELVSFAETPNSTTNPANAHTRLLILTILVPLITTLPGLFTVIRGFSGLIAHRNKFLTVTCAGLDMGFLPFPSDGLGEERFREVLRERGLMGKHGETGGASMAGEALGEIGDVMRSKEEEKKQAEEDAKRVEVLSVFGVPTTARLDRLVAERQDVLDRLEANEVRYINSFSVNPVTREEEDENAPPEQRPARFVSLMAHVGRLSGADCRLTCAGPSVAVPAASTDVDPRAALLVRGALIVLSSQAARGDVFGSVLSTRFAHPPACRALHVGCSEATDGAQRLWDPLPRGGARLGLLWR